MKSLSLFFTRHQKDFWAVTGLLVLTLWTLRSFFSPGLFYTHDGFFHFMRAGHFFEELGSSQFPVRWSSQMMYGLGYPLFNYVFVLPYYFTSFFHLFGTDFANSVRILEISSSVVTAVGWYVWLRFFFKPFPSFVGAVISWMAPYRFLMLFVTGQLGTITAWMFVPLLLIGLQGIFVHRKTQFYPKIFWPTILASFSLAGLITAHLVTAISVAPFLCCYLVAIFLMLWQKEKKQLHKILPKTLLWLGSAFVLGLGLSAFYWLPATLELRWISASQKAIVDYREHFPTLKQLIYSPWGYGFSGPGPNDGLSFQVGFGQWAAITLGLVAGLYLLASKFKKKFEQTEVLIFLMILAFGVYLFLTLPISQFVWQALPLLQTVQHPWRLLIGFVLASSVVAAFLSSRKFGVIFGIIFVILAFINTRNYMRPMELRNYSEAELLTDPRFGGSGDVSLEFLPVWADPSLRPTQNLFELDPSTAKGLTTDKDTASLEVTKPTQVTFQKYFFPTWVVTDNQNKIKTVPSDKGLLSVHLDSGKHDLKLVMSKTSTEQVAEKITLLTLILLSGLGIYGQGVKFSQSSKRR